jgi:murein tripeptide amidase MpaA
MEVNYVNASNPYKKSVLITGAHHARELTSISMNMYLLLKTIYGYYIKDEQTMSLLNSTNLYFIPMINTDGVKLISELYNETGGKLVMIRKNRNDGKKDRY